jgi:hypothetical protein
VNQPSLEAAILAQNYAAPKTGLPAEAGISELTNSGYMIHQLLRIHIILFAERIQVDK